MYVYSCIRYRGSSQTTLGKDFVHFWTPKEKFKVPFFPTFTFPIQILSSEFELFDPKGPQTRSGPFRYPKGTTWTRQKQFLVHFLTPKGPKTDSFSPDLEISSQISCQILLLKTFNIGRDPSPSIFNQFQSIKMQFKTKFQSRFLQISSEIPYSLRK